VKERNRYSWKLIGVDNYDPAIIVKSNGRLFRVKIDQLSQLKKLSPDERVQAANALGYVRGMKAGSRKFQRFTALSKIKSTRTGS
jgi:hypothetical protein